MAAETEQVLCWRGGGLRPAPAAPARLLVADSFLVTEGSVVALDLHRQRFLASVGDPAVSAFAGTALPRDGDAFWAAAVAQLPLHGSWFPRLELVATGAGPEFRLRIRPAPPLGTTVRAATWHGHDPRRVPSVKGPDLEALLEVRRSVVAVGGEEGVLLSPDGSVCDGTTSAVVWWEGATLCTPPAAAPRVDSVTARVVLELADAAGVAVRQDARRPEQLAGREVWVLNALHGIRRVGAWVDGPALGAEEGRLDVWRSRLEERRRPLG